MTTCSDIKTLACPFHVDDKDKIYVGWADILQDEEMLTSVWTIPAGWTLSNELINGTAVIDGVEESKVNGGLFKAPSTKGVYELKNSITTANLELTRKLVVYVTPCI